VSPGRPARLALVLLVRPVAHHPSAIEMTLAGLRSRVGSARILAVLEPRSNTMRLGVWHDALAPSLAAADRVYCYGSNVGWDVGAALSALGDKAVVIDDLDVLIEAVARDARSGDSVLAMSNGGFGGMHAKLLARLAANNRVAGELSAEGMSNLP
jgi:UDP-N-acetylmuramate: L-alanyl-gamma-D-glutamyl-meso-diaminopimelate ligase